MTFPSSILLRGLLWVLVGYFYVGNAKILGILELGYERFGNWVKSWGRVGRDLWGCWYLGYKM